MLHEDLNRVKKKPYIPDMDFNGLDFEKYSREAWERSNI